MPELKRNRSLESTSGLKSILGGQACCMALAFDFFSQPLPNAWLLASLDESPKQIPRFGLGQLFESWTFNVSFLGEIRFPY